MNQIHKSLGAKSILRHCDIKLNEVTVEVMIACVGIMHPV